TVAAVLRVGDDGQAFFAGQQIRGAVRGAVVDDQDVRAMTAYLAEDGVQMTLFVVNRNGRENLHALRPFARSSPFLPPTLHSRGRAAPESKARKRPRPGKAGKASGPCRPCRAGAAGQAQADCLL